MSATHTLTLAGCTPVPLAHYLKALGILRLVSQQKDSLARGRWHHDQFILESSLDCDGLLRFFLDEYQPTPILSPWNGGSGFYFQEEKLNQRDPATNKKIKTGIRNQETAATRVITKILQSNDARLAAYRHTIEQTKGLLEAKGLISAPNTDGSDKDNLVIELRSIWPDLAVEWLDCVAVLTSSSDAKSRTGLKPCYTTLLGSGANDGNADFTSNFMQRLTNILEASREKALKWLETALFAENHPHSRVSALAGQYSPGTAGGANSTSGFTSKFSINPWDFVLLIEGTLFFAAAAVRQHDHSSEGSIAYPFCVTASGVGYPSAAPNDEKADNSITEEMWLPLWRNSCSKDELQAIFGEGRAQLRGRSVKTGVDFAQAICSLGTDVGIDSFQRMGFFVRNGKSVFATPLTRVFAKKNDEIDLLREVDMWLDSFRRAATKSSAPTSVRRALTNIETCIFDLCAADSPERQLSVFIALGQCEKAMCKSLRWAKENFLKPLHGLSKAWLKHSGHHPIEFRLAASLASVNGRFTRNWLPIRVHLEPVDAWLDKKHNVTFRWSEVASNNVQWSEGSLPDVLNDILARRLILNEDTEKRFECWSGLADIKDFIENRVDDVLLSDLLWSMSLINWQEQTELSFAPKSRPPVPPTFYALLKLCFPPMQKESPEHILPVPIVAGIHRHASRGNGSRATEMAYRRLRASGYRLANQQLLAQGNYAKRSAAALLFPISDQSFSSILEHTTRTE